jgi:hypothetical protein
MIADYVSISVFLGLGLRAWSLTKRGANVLLGDSWKPLCGRHPCCDMMTRACPLCGILPKSSSPQPHQQLHCRQTPMGGTFYRTWPVPSKTLHIIWQGKPKKKSFPTGGGGHDDQMLGGNLHCIMGKWETVDSSQIWQVWCELFVLCYVTEDDTLGDHGTCGAGSAGVYGNHLGCLCGLSIL